MKSHDKFFLQDLAGEKKALDPLHSLFPIECLIFDKMISIENDLDDIFEFLGVLPQQQNMAMQSGLLTQQMPKTEPTKPKFSRKRKSCQDNGSPEECKKKIIHRDVERQRRKEMARLHSSLRSLVPYQFVQVNYECKFGKKICPLCVCLLGTIIHSYHLVFECVL